MRRFLTGWLLSVVVGGLSGLAAAGHGGPDAPLAFISAADLKALLDRGRPLVVDLRPVDAFRQGHLPGARSIPLRELRRRAVEIPRERLVLYCGCPGDELEAAYRFLTGLGIERIQALEGDFAGWLGRGYPLER